MKRVALLLASALAATLVGCFTVDTVLPPVSTWWPMDVATGPDGNLYVSALICEHNFFCRFGGGNGEVRVFNPAGRLLRSFPSEAAGEEAQLLDQVDGLAVDHAGDVYVVSHPSGRGGWAKRYRPDGSYVDDWHPRTVDGLELRPADLAFDDQGNRFVAFGEGTPILKFGPDGSYLPSWTASEIPAAAEAINRLSIARSGDIVLLLGRRSVYVVAPDGAVRAQWVESGTGSGRGARGLSAFDTSGNVYAAFESGVVRKFSPSGAVLATFGAPGAGRGRLSDLHGLAVDGAGNVYVANTYNMCITKFSPTGAVLAEFGPRGV